MIVLFFNTGFGDWHITMESPLADEKKQNNSYFFLVSW